MLRLWRHGERENAFLLKEADTELWLMVAIQENGLRFATGKSRLLCKTFSMFSHSLHTF